MVWLLLGNRKGDNHQLFSLANALCLPFRTKKLTYNQLRRLRFLRGPRVVSLTKHARRLIVPPWPDLVIGSGYGTVPVARYIRKQTGGRAKIVQIGNPRTSIADLDLLITTPQYARQAAPNVLALPFPIGNPAREVDASEIENAWLSRCSRPRRLIAVGGPANNWKVDLRLLEDAVELQLRKCLADNGSVIVAGSARTPASLLAAMRRSFEARGIKFVDDFPRFAVLLRAADEIYVTGDSVSMLSEAIFTGRPVGMIPITRSARGMLSKVVREMVFRRSPFPDLPAFWNSLATNKLVGDAAYPIATNTEDTVTVAVEAVRRLLSAPTQPKT